MLHITICDDDEIISQKMRRVIEDAAKEMNQQIAVEMFAGGGEFLEQYQAKEKELLFIDIDMPVKSGIEVTRQLEGMGRNRNVVLITSYDHLVLRSLSCAPFQIIRKQEMDTDIPLALGRYLKEWNRQRPVLELRGSGRIYRIESRNIRFIEKMRHYVIIHQEKGGELKIRGNMQELEQELSDKGFVRVHTGYMVNLRYCLFLEKNDIVLNGGPRLPVSRDRKKAVREQFMISRR